MVGPSSSHTAGACRIGWIARQLLGEPPLQAHIDLHGSFAATGDGHGTKEALAAGVLGYAPDDLRLKDALEHAQKAGMQIGFGETDLGPQAHPNSVDVHLSGETCSVRVRASSVGGGSVLIEGVDGFPIEFRGNLETLVLWHTDTAGFLARVTAVLACAEINVAGIRTSRRERGEEALTAIEVDGVLPQELLDFLGLVRAIRRTARVPVVPGL